ncbi:MAG: hypothetical protein KC931_10330, partial [Candidatus Omnitrophica bacterium]|nr:hypothetical protein [Candidatus Omnitrophota bacterium]
VVRPSFRPFKYPGRVIRTRAGFEKYSNLADPKDGSESQSRMIRTRSQPGSVSTLIEENDAP